MQVTDLAQAAPSVWGMDPKIVATAIVVVCYAILFTEKLNRAVVALLGAALMIFSGILTQETALQGIDFNTISLLVGMMTIVGISEKSGMFQFVAVWGAKKVRANPRGLLIVLAFVTAVFSAFLDNVTTVLLIAPVTFQITRKLKINPYPYLILEIFASNIGGTATLIGDPPNILIGSALMKPAMTRARTNSDFPSSFQSVMVSFSLMRITACLFFSVVRRLLCQMRSNPKTRTIMVMATIGASS